MKIKEKITPTFIQHIVLSFLLFTKNDLITYAAAGAYGFLCSLLPVVMMILLLLINIFHASPDKVLELLNVVKDFFPSIDFNNILDSVLKVKKFGALEIIISFSTLWMARRFFMYVMRGFRQIFRKQNKQKTSFINLIALISEILLVLVISLFIFIVIVAQSILSMINIEKFIPLFLQKQFIFLLNLLPYGVMFVFITISYRFAPRTTPPLKLCMLASGVCTLIFFVISLSFKIFINLNHYNFVYGVLSNLIVLLFKVFIFFILMMFFAQFVFVSQFFDILLFEQLYLLPPRTTLSPKETLIRSVFMIPKKVLESQKLCFEKNETIFCEKDTSDSIYYILQGSVTLHSNNRIDYFATGSFVGEIECIMKKPRFTSLYAQEKTTLLKIPYKNFTELLDFSTEANQEVMNTISKHYWYK